MKENKITYNIAQFKDIESIIDITAETFPYNLKKYTILGCNGYSNYLNAIILYPNKQHTIYVAIKENQIIGFAHFRFIDEILFLNHIFVLPKFQGQKVGKDLLALGIKEGLRLNLFKLQLDVFQDNLKALNWYLKFGMSKISDSFWYEISINHSKIDNYLTNNIVNAIASKAYYGFAEIELTVASANYKIGYLDSGYYKSYNLDIVKPLAINALADINWANKILLILNEEISECQYLQKNEIIPIAHSYRLEILLKKIHEHII